MFSANIIDYGNEFWKNKITFIKEFLPVNEYTDMIEEIDVAILPEKGSYALGCISRLLRYKKKIYISKDGIIKKAFDYDNIPYGIYENIKNESFELFSEPVVYTDKSGLNMKPLGYINGVKKWHELYAYLDNLQQQRENRNRI